MLLYFFRHASAGKSMLNPKKDERRPLDEEGILQVRYVGRRAGKSGCPGRPDYQ